jgi:tagatose 1,6-diphosphate aldolase GatY/KbaY
MAAEFSVDDLRRAQRQGWAIGAFSIYNLEQAQAVCAAAEQEGRPALIQAGASAFTYAGQGPLAQLSLECAKDCYELIGVHLDHSRDPEEIAACLRYGYTSVMYDGSALPLEENIRITRQVVSMAHAAGAWVEAELAGIAGDEDESTDAIAGAMTDPDVAARFVNETGVDALAVAIGNVHGIPREPVRLDLERLKAIRACVEIPLVLHGASGLLEEDVTAAIGLGVAKVNVNTELRQALRLALAEPISDRDDLGSLLGPARSAMQAVVAEKIRLFTPASRAPAGGS